MSLRDDEKYIDYQLYRDKQRLYRDKQRASYFADEEVISLEEYEYQINKRDNMIRDLQREVDSFRNLRSELDKIKSSLLIAGVIHTRDEVVCLSDKVSWVLERQQYRINELGLQVDEP